jgi:hypothetical protein
MTEKWNLVNPELALAEVGIQFVHSEPLQHKPQMFLMLCFRLGIYQDIINEYHHKGVQIIHENLVHQMHEESRSIRQAKRHDHILI